VLCHSSILFLVAGQFKFKLTSDSKKKMDEVTHIDCDFFFLFGCASVLLPFFMLFVRRSLVFYLDTEGSILILAFSSRA
jgi:hypothetical protein